MQPSWTKMQTNHNYPMPSTSWCWVATLQMPSFVIEMIISPGFRIPGCQRNLDSGLCPAVQKLRYVKIYLDFEGERIKT